jgi:hypothetical protein
MWKGLGWLSALLFAVLGCRPTESRIQPPPLHEEYTLPPDSDSRFSQPPVFPKEARNNGPRKPTDGPTAAPPTMRGPGSPRLGGPGGMGGF